VPVLLAVAIIAALWLLGVRDWRCFGATFLSPAVLTSISIGTLTPLVMLMVAAAWRWRNSRRTLALVLGAVVAAKLFVWPLLLWGWLTRRRLSAAGGTAVAVGLLVLLSLPLGIGVIPRYVRLLQRDGDVVGPLSYGLASLASSGTTLFILEAVSVALIVVVAVASVRFKVQEREAFVAAVTASLLLTPIVHLHYVALVYVVAAILQPEFGWVWVAPVALWLTAQQDTNGDRWRTCLVLAILGAVIVGGRRRVSVASLRA